MCGYRMDVELVGADPAARVTAEEPTGGWSSYYRGGAEGATRLPRFRRVVYHDIYPGIDMAFSHDSSGVKYDFIVHPGGDPGNIALRYIGADSLVREPSGMLNAAVPLGVLREGAPFTYQPAGGNARPDDGDARLRVPCEYLVGGDMVRFSLGAYDRRATLVIDPTLAWATYCGGIRAEALDVKGTDLIVDAAGNVYVVDRGNNRVLKLAPGRIPRSCCRSPASRTPTGWRWMVPAASTSPNTAEAVGWWSWRRAPPPRVCCRSPALHTSMGWRWMPPATSTSPRTPIGW